MLGRILRPVRLVRGVSRVARGRVLQTARWQRARWQVGSIRGVHGGGGGDTSSSLFGRVRWLLKRSYKPFNVDDFSAIFSWLLVSHAVLFVVSTTTFASLFIYTMNTVSAQEWLAQKVGNFVTKNTPTTVIFEHAIVPFWWSHKIAFTNVFVSRRPESHRGTPEQRYGVVKGSQSEAVQRARLALSENLLVSEQEFDDGNYTQFDLTIDKVEISLSFTKWLNGGGIVDEVSINGLRGVVDRTHLKWSPGDDPANYKNIHQPGDFELSRFQLDDVLFTLYQPNGFRPFQVSIINCQLPRLRKHWLLYDILNAHSVSGTYDNSMFTIHKKLLWAKDSLEPRMVTQLRVDNLDIDHLNAGIEGPFGWITEGRVDMTGNVHFPQQDLTTTPWTDAVIAKLRQVRGQTTHMASKGDHADSQSDKIMVDFSLRLKNIRAEVPLFTRQLTYANNALIRPIVGYMNSRRTYIPINCEVTKSVTDFMGSWTIYDSHLIQDLGVQVYDSFAQYVADDEQRSIRVRRVTFWSLQLMLQVVLMALGAIA
ncbi:Mdm31p KNAG_0M00290 [Huiozyma naganishii CBS 8797]|uniref:Mitochondrial distribution and morphology protein 31 n=1 Tax=Huiozyma naganishii (strain ATCC MYA-139 / BCRC 22969 / CBS 8797 / KCTC 17520 / NBRC 10181 / NCYC 3082 / Yp74L-3) TaxID=1071383 RepID=J7S3X7_HUIN7|nr:hypothetical protein KNAG_0M00290 [Kazachstania naganishii CBS 8797]CCK72882.1 hypothetical protein KNAG_0M00290 [Kazachstania naganishii CBS 8797]